MLHCVLKIMILEVVDLLFFGKYWSFSLGSLQGGSQFLSAQQAASCGMHPDPASLGNMGTVLSWATGGSSQCVSAVIEGWSRINCADWRRACLLVALASIFCQWDIAPGKLALGLNTVCQIVEYVHLSEGSCLSGKAWSVIRRQGWGVWRKPNLCVFL